MRIYGHSQIYSDHSTRVAHLDLDMEEDINWDELSRTGWNGWSAEKLQVRWADLKAGVDSRATHRGEYGSTYHLVPHSR